MNKCLVIYVRAASSALKMDCGLDQLSTICMAEISIYIKNCGVRGGVICMVMVEHWVQRM